MSDVETKLGPMGTVPWQDSGGAMVIEEAAYRVLEAERDRWEGTARGLFKTLFKTLEEIEAELRKKGLMS